MKGLGFSRSTDLQFLEAHPLAGHELRGGASAALASPSEFPLWCVIAHLDKDAEIDSGPRHGEEALYVVSGAVEIDGQVCPTSGAIILEAGSHGTVRATESAVVVNFGCHAPAAEGRSDARVHVVGARGVYAVDEEGRDTHWYSDEECDGCAMSLHYSGRRYPWITEPHSHSQSEILYVVNGQMRFGSHTLSAGSTVAVEADRRYAFRSDDGGLAFVNYRAAASLYTADRAKPPIPESPILQDFVRVMDHR